MTAKIGDLIKIVKCSSEHYWYSYYVGDTFEVTSIDENGEPSVEAFDCDDYGAIDNADYEIVGSIKKVTELVHSPKHYSVFDGVEAIEIIARSMTQIEFRGYCMGNLLKYKLRCGMKDDVMQELSKAEKYKELYEKYKSFCIYVE